MSTEFDLAPDLGTQLFPEETADEAVARIVAQNPQKHGIPLAEREHRMIEQARRIAAETQAFFDAPDDEHTAELQQVVEDADVLANQVAGAPTITLDDIERIKTEGPEAVLGPPDVVLPGICEHSWPEDPDEYTRCPNCQMTFADWVNS